ncbi:MAG: DUF2339 domain-containing protein, partial [Gammaproteobacteria bacterium]|nr:DUF2339 domain-containing protein [Gammaproteobacteria bacterium]
MPIIYTLASIMLGFAMDGYRVALILGLVTAVISLFFFFNRKINTLNDELTRLKKALAKDWQDRQEKNEDQGNKDQHIAAPESAVDSISTLDTLSQPPSADALPEEPIHEKPVMVMASTKSTAVKKSVVFETTKQSEPNKLAEFCEKIIGQIKGYFTDGNLFVRIGILVLFFGVAFLLKYAAEHSHIPIEVRFIGAALGGLILLVFGWRLRHKNTTYALLLQGAGIGVIYITIFAAYRLQELIPPLLTFILLIAFAGFSSLLAVLQNSKSLAAFSILGGFLAPLLASSGSGNYVGLFSYYVVLNIAVLMMAWYKSWRALNLIGFVFTFGVYTLWLVKSYQPDMLISADLFLILFFMMYSAIGILYALRQPINMKGYVDGTLIFGTPLIVTSLQMALVRHTEYGIAISAAVFGIYYVLLTRFLWQRHGQDLRLLAEAMLAIGVIFLTLAIPYALNGHWTSATWALEAAGILWVAIKQNKKYTQYFALLLQVAAGLLFLSRNAADFGDTAWLNPAFMGGVFVALGGLITAWQLFKLFKVTPAASAGKCHL